MEIAEEIPRPEPPERFQIGENLFWICKTFSDENAQLCNMTTMAYHVSFDLNDGVIDHVLQLYETPEVSHIVEPTISQSSSSQNDR